MKYFLVSIILTSALGCQTTHIHAISGQELMVVRKNIPFTPKADGWFVSNKVMKNVLKAKVD